MGVLRACVIFAVAVILSGCSVQKNIAWNDLVGDYVLVSIDGKAFGGNTFSAPEITFGEEFRIYGAICNRFSGRAELRKGVLSAKRLAMTKMLCADQVLNSLEREFGSMLEIGAPISLVGEALMLEHGEHSLKFIKKSIRKH